LSSCSKSAMTRYSSWQRGHSGKRTTARLDVQDGSLSDLTIEVLQRSAVDNGWISGIGQ
jgi:hypothetical protein